MIIQIQIGFNQVCSFQGSYVKYLSCNGGHVLFQINTKTYMSITYEGTENKEILNFSQSDNFNDSSSHIELINGRKIIKYIKDHHSIFDQFYFIWFFDRKKD